MQADCCHLAAAALHLARHLQLLLHRCQAAQLHEVSLHLLLLLLLCHAVVAVHGAILQQHLPHQQQPPCEAC